ncbi:uncharacterized protein PHACADRAFT_248987 [Phanerochaete carnosa HHB-10118-sp]|uniref:Uncharacterized protein n=1 Tax=Phanerochaete carnosa (strain HHB-10118-sp) TaxID=650164 RepID=K5X7R4_PHACS|nr:uncharacterized protein PHACADRAFT_248987 [Phanerochaete carnosa HHB-10118-sp]EKM58882.1 hypothetical protein PHACADRAFT_248987 [Phanerochaete carnosa HHB-10118-sp]
MPTPTEVGPDHWPEQQEKFRIYISPACMRFFGLVPLLLGLGAFPSIPTPSTRWPISPFLETSVWRLDYGVVP